MSDYNECDANLPHIGADGYVHRSSNQCAAAKASTQLINQHDLLIRFTRVALRVQNAFNEGPMTLSNVLARAREEWSEADDIALRVVLQMPAPVGVRRGGGTHTPTIEGEPPVVHVLVGPDGDLIEAHLHPQAAVDARDKRDGVAPGEDARARPIKTTVHTIEVKPTPAHLRGG